MAVQFTDPFAKEVQKQVMSLLSNLRQHVTACAENATLALRFVSLLIFKAEAILLPWKAKSLAGKLKVILPFRISAATFLFLT